MAGSTTSPLSQDGADGPRMALWEHRKQGPLPVPLLGTLPVRTLTSLGEPQAPWCPLRLHLPSLQGDPEAPAQPRVSTLLDTLASHSWRVFIGSGQGTWTGVAWNLHHGRILESALQTYGPGAGTQGLL